jgi:hypothetical protein
VAYYRFLESVKQTDYIEFGISIGEWFSHLKAMGIGVTDVRLRGGKLCFNTTAVIPQELLDHLDNKVEPG